MYAIQLMEGKDCPKERPSEGGTASLLLRLCKALCSTRKIAVLDSGFYVLNALIVLKMLGSLRPRSSRSAATGLDLLLVMSLMST